jgi:hypothetical protein
LTSTCPAYVADDTLHVSCFASGCATFVLLPTLLSTTHFPLGALLLFARSSSLESVIHLTHIRTRALGTQTRCRLSSTTRCRRRCEVSTWTDPISTYTGGDTWRKRQQRFEYVAVERFKEHLSRHTNLFARLFAARDQSLQNTPLCAGWYKAAGLDIACDRYKISNIADS